MLKQKLKNIPILGDTLMILKRLPSFFRRVFLVRLYYLCHSVSHPDVRYIITDTPARYANENGNVEIQPMNCHGRGFFSIVNEILDEISANNEKHIEVWLSDTAYNNTPDENMWDYYFEPVNNTEVVRQKLRLSFNTRPSLNNLFSERRDHIELFNRVVRERVRIKPEILAKADAFVREHFKGRKVIAVHYRGTNIMISIDAVSQMYRKAPEGEYFAALDKLLAEGYERIFLSTDDGKTLERFRARYGDKLLFYTALKQGKPRAIFLDYSQKPPRIPDAFTPREFGEGVLINVLLLSRCDYFFYGLSNVSAVVKYLNPSLPSHDFDIKYHSRFMQTLIGIGVYANTGNLDKNLIRKYKT